MRIDRCKALSALGALAVILGAGVPWMPAWAQAAFPNRPIKVTVPFPAGGPFDGLPRVVLQDITDSHGWTFVLENRVGADGQIGVLASKRAPADGYNLLAMTSITHGSVPALKLNLGYDANSEFVPIVLLGEATMALQVKKDV